MKNVTTTGTVKVGRWTYPAEQDAQGTIRNTKRDGTGEWVKVDADAFVPDAAPAKPAAKTVEASLDYKLALAVAKNTYETYIWGTADDIRPEGVSEKRTLEILRKLRDANLLVEEKSSSSDGFVTGQPIFQATPCADEASLEEYLAIVGTTLPLDLEVKVRAVGGHPVTNNTHKKPGRSTWTVGSNCPQGHKLATSDDIYTMPSGRKQCQKCRKGYPSNI